jgi:hypothetical protein
VEVTVCDFKTAKYFQIMDLLVIFVIRNSFLMHAEVLCGDLAREVLSLDLLKANAVMAKLAVCERGYPLDEVNLFEDQVKTPLPGSQADGKLPIIVSDLAFVVIPLPVDCLTVPLATEPCSAFLAFNAQPLTRCDLNLTKPVCGGTISSAASQVGEEHKKCDER